MPRWGFHARTIVEEHAATASVVSLGKQFARFDEAFDALQWLLARSCDKLESKSAVYEDDVYYLYRAAGDLIAGTPDITVVFTYNDDEVVILDVKAERAENGE